MPDTSQEAYQVALRNSKVLAYRLYLQIQDAGQHGVTRDDLVQTFTAMGIDQSTVTARVRGLVASKLVTDGPDRRPTRKDNPAKVVRAIPGLDFKTLYRERSAKEEKGLRCSKEEREFLDRCHALAMWLKGATDDELKRSDSVKVLWDAFAELRKTPGIVHTGSGFRDSLGGCAWCHDKKCGNGCVT